ncbi:MAG: AraC family transcriptional regulator [Intestinibacillus sp.]
MTPFRSSSTRESSFLDGRMPRLLNFFNIEHENGWLPRAMHAHDGRAELVYIAEGHGIHRIGDSTYHTGPGDVLIFNAETPHDERPKGEEPLRFYSCAITNLRLRGLRENWILPAALEPVLHMGAEKGRVEELFGMLHNTLRRGGPRAYEQGRFLMISLLLEVLEYAQEHAVPRVDGEITLGQRIKQYIDENYLKNLTLTSISEYLGISPYYLSRLLKERTGYSPMQYIINRRMGEAQNLLIDTDDSITRVAERVGYDNPNYFNLLFKKNIGVTPGQYRKIIDTHEKY